MVNHSRTAKLAQKILRRITRSLSRLNGLLLLLGFHLETLKERNLLGDLGVDNRIMLKTDVTEQTGCDEMDWIYLAQIMDHWQVLVNPVRNIQVLYNVRPCLVKQMLVSQ
jgi:hypothetical protein